MTANTELKITLGYQPSYVAAVTWKSASAMYFAIYNEDYGASTQFVAAKNGSAISVTQANLAAGYGVKSIDTDGFTMMARPLTYGDTLYWFASR